MRSTLIKILLVSGLWLGLAMPALAAPERPGVTQVGEGKRQVRRADRVKLDKRQLNPKRKKVRTRAKGQQVVASVPELDPNAAGLALILLAGGTLLIIDRRRVQA